MKKRFTLNPVLDIETLTWIANDGESWEEPRLLLQGPSDEAKQNEAAAAENEKAQAAFYKQYTQQQTTTFAEQQDLLSTLKASALPIVAGGVNQYGFSPEEDATFQSLINTGADTQEQEIAQQAAIEQASLGAQGDVLRSQITDAGSQQAENVINATELAQLQKSGGAALPSGGNTQIEETARVVGAQQTAANIAAEQLQEQQQKYGTQLTSAQETAAVEQARQQQLLNEKISGYSAGGANYSNAINSLTGQAQIANPIQAAQALTSAGNATTGASTASTSAIHLVDSEKSNLLQSILGGAVGAGATALTGGAAAGVMGMDNAVGNFFK